MARLASLVIGGIVWTAVTVVVLVAALLIRTALHAGGVW